MEFQVNDISCGGCAEASPLSLRQVDPAASVNVDIAAETFEGDFHPYRLRLCSPQSQNRYDPVLKSNVCPFSPRPGLFRGVGMKRPCIKTGDKRIEGRSIPSRDSRAPRAYHALRGPVAKVPVISHAAVNGDRARS